MKTITIKTMYYQQFDADLSMEVPGEGYKGWQAAELPVDLHSTGFVFMHAWNCGTPEQYPGVYRACEYIPRANKISETVLPPLLSALRKTKANIYHVAGDAHGLDKYPGYHPAIAAQRSFSAPKNETSAVLHEFRSRNVFTGKHNEEDCDKSAPHKNFHPGAAPKGDEPIFLDEETMAKRCVEDGVNHLIYSGFAINWCLAMSPCGMFDMGRRGFICSAIRDAVTAVENKESARTESHKEEALWRTAIAWGFVYDSKDIIGGIL